MPPVGTAGAETGPWWRSIAIPGCGRMRSRDCGGTRSLSTLDTERGQTLAWWLRYRYDISVNEQVSELARALAAQRRQVSEVCAVCGKTFTATVRRRYCTPACRQAAVRQRRRVREANSSDRKATKR
jgi:hypothetical protein